MFGRPDLQLPLFVTSQTFGRVTSFCYLIKPEDSKRQLASAVVRASLVKEVLAPAGRPPAFSHAICSNMPRMSQKKYPEPSATECVFALRCFVIVSHFVKRTIVILNELPPSSKNHSLGRHGPLILCFTCFLFYF